jgi:hypothetical protein
METIVIPFILDPKVRKLAVNAQRSHHTILRIEDAKVWFNQWTSLTSKLMLLLARLDTTLMGDNIVSAPADFLDALKLVFQSDDTRKMISAFCAAYTNTLELMHKHAAHLDAIIAATSPQANALLTGIKDVVMAAINDVYDELLGTFRSSCVGQHSDFIAFAGNDFEGFLPDPATLGKPALDWLRIGSLGRNVATEHLALAIASACKDQCAVRKIKLEGAVSDVAVQAALMIGHSMEMEAKDLAIQEKQKHRLLFFRDAADQVQAIDLAQKKFLDDTDEDGHRVVDFATKFYATSIVSQVVSFNLV